MQQMRISLPEKGESNKMGQMGRISPVAKCSVVDLFWSVKGSSYVANGNIGLADMGLADFGADPSERPGLSTRKTDTVN